MTYPQARAITDAALAEFVAAHAAERAAVHAVARGSDLRAELAAVDTARAAKWASWDRVEAARAYEDVVDAEVC